jgi:hypothetical protein
MLADLLRKERAKLEKLLTTEELAAQLGISQKQGPCWVRLGRGRRAPIRYRPEAIEEYIHQMESACA